MIISSLWQKHINTFIKGKSVYVVGDKNFSEEYDYYIYNYGAKLLHFRELSKYFSKKMYFLHFFTTHPLLLPSFQIQISVLCRVQKGG